MGAAFAAVPWWLVALVLGAAAPVLVGVIERALELRLRRRTLALIARSKACEGSDAAVVGKDPPRA